MASERKSASLALRLTAIALVWSLLALAAGAFLLSRIFQQSVERTFDRRLESDLDLLSTKLVTDQSRKVVRVDPFSDQLYDRAFSGWYWQVTPLVDVGGVLVPAPADPPEPPDAAGAASDGTDEDGLMTSRSLWDSRLSLPGGLRLREERRGAIPGPQAKELRYIVRIRTIGAPAEAQKPAAATSGVAYALMVAADIGEIRADIQAFNQTLVWSVMILAAGLLLAVAVQVRLGLAPLRRIREALAGIREGRKDKLEGAFPAEIAPLAEELNALVAHNQEVVARARTHVGNLAHFLKTPLTVLANEAAGERTPLAEAVMRQTQIMRRQVDHYLARARAAGSNMLIGSRTEAGPVIADLARTLEKIYGDRGVEIETDLEPGAHFRGERQDLEEMAGNLLDNACKWARTAVRVSVKTAAPGQILVIVEDDGPGLSAESREKVMRRGERLDESKPGSGLGLSIVRDIAGLYGGKIGLAESALGGLEARLTLPGAGKA